SWGFSSPDVGIIGRSPGAEPDGSRCYFFDAQRLYPGLLAAFSEPVPTAPSRVKECQTCEFHNHCRAQLLQTQDISLLLPGDRNRPWRDKGINTLPALAAAGRGRPALWPRPGCAARWPSAGRCSSGTAGRWFSHRIRSPWRSTWTWRRTRAAAPFSGAPSTVTNTWPSRISAPPGTRGATSQRCGTG